MEGLGGTLLVSLLVRWADPGTHSPARCLLGVLLFFPYFDNQYLNLFKLNPLKAWPGLTSISSYSCYRSLFLTLNPATVTFLQQSLLASIPVNAMMTILRLISSG